MSRTEELLGEAKEKLSSKDVQDLQAGVRLAAKLFDSWMGTPTSLIDPELEGVELSMENVQELRARLVSLLSEVESPRMKGTVVWALGRCPDSGYVELFVDVMGNPEECDPYLLYQILASLNNCGEDVLSGEMRGFEHREENVKDAKKFLKSRGAAT